MLANLRAEATFSLMKSRVVSLLRCSHWAHAIPDRAFAALQYNLWPGAAAGVPQPPAVASSHRRVNIEEVAACTGSTVAHALASTWSQGQQGPDEPQPPKQTFSMQGEPSAQKPQFFSVLVHSS